MSLHVQHNTDTSGVKLFSVNQIIVVAVVIVAVGHMSNI